MLMWSAKWLGQSKIRSSAIIDFPLFKKNPQSDLEITKAIWPLMNEADIIIGHNSNNFDLKWINGCFILHGIKPPSPYKTIDTYKELNKNARFVSHSLKYSCKKLGIGAKEETGGFPLWKKCMDGHKPSFSKMRRYCMNDTRITEQLYLALKPYISSHPNMNLYNGSEGCPLCGSNNILHEGFIQAVSYKRKRFSCKDCGKWFSSSEVVSISRWRKA